MKQVSEIIAVIYLNEIIIKNLQRPFGLLNAFYRTSLSFCVF